MDERLRIILEAQDRAAAAFRQVAAHTRTMNQNLRAVQTTAAQMSSGTRNSLAGLNTSLRASAGQAGTASRSISTSLNAISLGAGRAVSALRQLPSVIAQAAAAASRAKGPLGGLAGFALNRAMPGIGLASGAAGLLGGLGAGAAGVAFGQRGVEMNLTKQGGLTALTSLLGGNKGQAAGFMKELEQEAAQSLPTLKQLIPLATQLVQAYGPQGLGKVIPTIRAFGDAAAIAAGGDTNRMELALLGFRQILNRGVAQQEELNQIGENLGVNVTDILKGSFGTADTEELGGRGVSGAAVADAIVKGLAAKFGGAQLRQSKTLPGLTSNVDDALNALAGQATEGMTRGLGGAMEKVLGALNKALERGSLVESMSVIFGTFGKVVEALAGQLEKVFKWIEQIAKADGLKLFLINAIALGQVLGERLLKLFGVDLKKAMDPKNVSAWFNALGEAVTGAIDTAFGLARVWKEVGVLLKGFWTDMGDKISDFAGDTMRSFQTMFANLEVGINDMALTFIGAFIAIVNGLNASLGQVVNPITGKKVFGTIGTQGLEDAQSQVLGRITQGESRVKDLQIEGQNAQALRLMRETAKDRADPFRGQDPFRRIQDAFTGKGRDTSDQTQFWADFEKNRLNVARGLFAGTGAAGRAAQPGFPSAPQLYGGGGGGGQGSVFIPPQVQVPAYAGTVSPWAGGPMQGAGAPGVNVVNLNINSPGLSAILKADPSFAAALQEFINAYLLAQGSLAYPGPTMP
jgi:tape measure domain-containing protein